MKHHIYALHDILDQNKTIKYVGQTTQLRERMRYHCSSGPKFRAVSAWIKDLLASGSCPAMSVLASTDDATEADRLEKEWIEKLSPDCNRQLNPSFKPLAKRVNLPAMDGLTYLEKCKAQAIAETLASAGSMAAAAAKLGVGRQTLYNWLAKYGLIT